MLDSFSRDIHYLRVSVTDRCNLRCRYCMPEYGVQKLSHLEILSLEDLARIIRASAACGIRKVRLTGGEPLIRKNLTQLMHYISEIPEIDDLALTTNGQLFAPMAEDFKKAGLTRVNISLDTMKRDRYRYITRCGDLDNAMKAIERALELDMHPVKLNVVAIRGFNDDEIMDFADLAYHSPLHIRFIEFMPVGDLMSWKEDRVIPADEIRQRIEARYTLLEGKQVMGSGPARYYHMEGGQGSVGFISPLSNHFCKECNRLRLTAEGKLRACLYDKNETDLREALRRGASDEELQQMIIQTINRKPEKHNMREGWGTDNKRKMYQIGG